MRLFKLRPPPTIVQDYLGGVALVVLLVAALQLPSVI